jgi:signal transduction histidine kinase/ActR/RegA family two-component response regulator
MDAAIKHYASMSRDQLLAEILAAEKAFGGERRLHDVVQELEVHREEIQVQQAQILETQRALEESRDRYADLYDFAPIAFLTLDRSGVIHEANFAAAVLLDRERARLVGFPLLVYVADNDRRLFLDHLARCRRTEGTVQTRLHLRGHGDVERVLVDVVSRRATQPNADLLWHTCLVDVSASERADQERYAVEVERIRLQHEEQAMRAAAATKDRFLAVLSHELRTPLTPILIKLGALEARGAIPPELKEPIAVVRRNIEVEARLIDDLLDTTRIVHGKLHMEIGCVDVHALLGSLIDTAASEIQAAGIELRVDLAAEEHHVRGDALRLRQVFWNLLSNAQRHTPGSGSIQLTTRNEQPGLLTIRVTDTGSGIEASLLPRIFEPFEQADGEKRAGLGLGLAISRGIVEAHQGKIRAHSDGGTRGTTMEVELETVPGPDVRTEPSALARRGHGGLRILLVEDHPDSAESLQELLGLVGHDVTLAPSFADAVSHRGEIYDLLISDIGLPDGDGLKLYDELRRDRTLRAIALSGYGSEQDIARSRRAGFHRHLTKPVGADDLLRTIDDVMGRVAVNGARPPRGEPEARPGGAAGPTTTTGA